MVSARAGGLVTNSHHQVWVTSRATLYFVHMKRPKRLIDGIRRTLFKGRPVITALRLAIQGRPISNPLTLLPARFDAYSVGSWVTFQRKGVHYRVDLSQRNEWNCFYNYFSPGHERFYKLLKPGYCVLDVGANIGHIASEMALRVVPGGKVVCFEPMPLTLARLKSLAEQNPQLPLVIEAIGLSDVSEAREMFLVAKNHSGANTFVEYLGSKPLGKTESLTLSTLDAYVQRANLGVVHAIKIDVEGFEMRVLKGAHQTLAHHKPLLFIEISQKHLAADGTTPEAVFTLLTGLGYTLYEAASGAPILGSAPMPHFDLLALPA